MALLGTYDPDEDGESVPMQRQNGNYELSPWRPKIVQQIVQRLIPFLKSAGHADREERWQQHETTMLDKELTDKGLTADKVYASRQRVLDHQLGLVEKREQDYNTGRDIIGREADRKQLVANAGRRLTDPQDAQDASRQIDDHYDGIHSNGKGKK